MKGKILDYSVQENTGVITAEDGGRYNFVGSEWKESGVPTKGALVDFDVQDKNALGVYKALNTEVNRGDTAKVLQGRFTAMWVCIAVGIPSLLLLIGIVPLFASAILYLMLLYRLWTLIPLADAKTSPGQAVGFLFIPLFNLYWFFVAFHGLAKSLNIESKRKGIVNIEVNEILSLTVCILNILCMIPYLNIVLMFVYLPIVLIVLKQMKDVGVALSKS